jgi:hypothetical protein
MSATGKWNVTVETPMGPQESELTLHVDGATFSGTGVAKDGTRSISGTVAGDKLTWTSERTVPIPMKLEFDVTVSGDTMTGTVVLGSFGTAPLKGTRVG